MPESESEFGQKEKNQTWTFDVSYSDTIERTQVIGGKKSCHMAGEEIPCFVLRIVAIAAVRHTRTKRKTEKNRMTSTSGMHIIHETAWKDWKFEM